MFVKKSLVSLKMDTTSTVFVIHMERREWWFAQGTSVMERYGDAGSKK